MNKERKLNVAMFSDSFYPVMGGRENVIDNLMEKLNKKTNCFLATINIKLKNKPEKIFPYKIYKCKGIKVAKDCYLGIINKSFKKEIEEKAKSGSIDIIHTQTKFSLTKYALKLRKKYNIPVITSCHTLYDYVYKAQSKLLYKILLKHTINTINKCDGVTTVSDYMKDKLIKLGVKKEIVVIKNGIEENEKFEFAEKDNLSTLKKYNIPTTNKILITVCRLTKSKNLEFLFKSLSMVKTPYTMVIVGGGNIKKYKKIATKYNVLNKTIFTGPIWNRKDLHLLYDSAYLHLQPSYIESFGLTVAESANCYTPSLVINSSATSENITNNLNGFISSLNEKEYASRIDELLENENLVKKASQLSHNTLVYHWDYITLEYINAYKYFIEKYKDLSKK